MTAGPKSPPSMTEVTVGDLLADRRLGIGLVCVAGERGFGRPIRHPRVQKSGLALAGHYFGVVPTRIQVLGETELSYLDALDEGECGQAMRGFFALGLSCVVVTRQGPLLRPVVQAAEATGTPLLQSEARSSRTINELHALLDEKLAPTTTMHGVLVDVFGIGLLLLGKSGIGKSECAVELVLRGHRLVADDIVKCEWRPPGMVFGCPADILRHHVEVRGLGVLNIKDLFGVTAVRERKRIDIVVQLDEWNASADYDRLGVDDRFFEILSTPIRLVTVPVRPGRDMGMMLEMAARNELLRRAGRHSARELLARIEENVALGVSVAMDDPPESVARTDGTARPPPAPNSSIARPELPSWYDSEPEQPAAAPVPPSPAPPPRDPRYGRSPDENDASRHHESSAWIPAIRPKDKG